MLHPVQSYLLAQVVRVRRGKHPTTTTEPGINQANHIRLITLSLSLTDTHTQTHTHTRTHSNTHTHTHALKHILYLTNTHTCTHTHSLSLISFISLFRI